MWNPDLAFLDSFHNANIAKNVRSQNIKKLADVVKVQNILHVHDYLTDSLPTCFQDSFFKLNTMSNKSNTRKSKLGCLSIPRRNSTRYRLNSITHQCISNWNDITRHLQTDLLKVNRNKLKSILKEHFIRQYWIGKIALTLRTVINIVNILTNNTLTSYGGWESQPSPRPAIIKLSLILSYHKLLTGNLAYPYSLSQRHITYFTL